MSSFWDDLTGSVASGLAGSDNPYLSTAGGLLGGGGGSGPVQSVYPAPPPPPPPVTAPAPVGATMPSWGLPVGIAVVGGAVILALAGGVRRSR